MKPLLRHLGFDLFLNLVAVVLVLVLLGAQYASGLPGIFLKVVLVVALSVLTINVWQLYHIRREIAVLMKLCYSTSMPVRDAVFRFLLEDLQATAVDRRSQLLNDGLTLDPDGLARLERACFGECRGKYIGTDRHVPSEFFDLYPSYLGSQSSRGTTEGDIRIVLYTKAEFDADQAAHPDDCLRFAELHEKDGVKLLRCDFGIADATAKRQQLPSCEIALFGWKFVVFYVPRSGKNAHGAKVRLMVIDEELNKRLQIFLTEIVKQAQRYSIEGRSVIWRDRHDGSWEDDVMMVTS